VYHTALCVVDDGVDRRVSDDVQVVLQLLVLFVELHELGRVHLHVLVQRLEDNVLGRQRLVAERALWQKFSEVSALVYISKSHCTAD